MNPIGSDLVPSRWLRVPPQLHPRPQGYEELPTLPFYPGEPIAVASLPYLGAKRRFFFLEPLASLLGAVEGAQCLFDES